MQKNVIQLTSALFLFFLLANTSLAVVLNFNDLNFSTTNQSLWGNGDAITPSTINYELNLDSRFTMGGITGSRNEVITQGYTESVWNPFTNWKCQERIFGKCIWGKFEGGWETITIDPVTADTRLGVEVEVTTRGNVGMTTNMGLNGGSVDAQVDYKNVELVVPDTIVVGEFFNLNPDSQVSSNITTKAPSLQGSIKANMGFSVNFEATECIIIGQCSSANDSLLHMPDEESTILQINTDGLPADKASIFELHKTFGDLALFDTSEVNLSADLYALPLPGKVYVSGLPFLDGPPEGVGINILELSLDAPGRNTASGDAQGHVQADNSINDMVRLELDYDSYRGQPGGGVIKSGGLVFRGDVYDVDFAPAIDYNQSIDFKPELMVDLVFSRPVYVEQRDQAGQLLAPLKVTHITAPWNDLPAIALLDDQGVNITPKFWLDNQFSNKTWMDYELNLALDILKGKFNFLSVDLWNSCLYCNDVLSVDLGSLVQFDETFMLSGFNEIYADSFYIGMKGTSGNNSGSTGAVPEPGLFIIFALGVLVLLSRHPVLNQPNAW